MHSVSGISVTHAAPHLFADGIDALGDAALKAAVTGRPPRQAAASQAQQVAERQLGLQVQTLDLPG
jgi:hypothetical protein